MIDIDPRVAADYFALVLLGGAALLALALTRPVTRRAVADDAVRLSSALAGGAMAGSLYFSEIADFPPCELCWYQRIAMYPIAVIGVVATIRRDRQVLPSIIVLSTIGLAISLYHVGIQLFPEQSSFCELDNPCSSRWVEGMGWMTIPRMAAVVFSGILTIAVVGRRADRSPVPSPSPSSPEHREVHP